MADPQVPEFVSCAHAADVLMPGWQQKAERVIHGHDQQVTFTVVVDGFTYAVQVTESMR
jgi:hypothetical protein